jgi:hypothetical protein
LTPIAIRVSLEYYFILIPEEGNRTSSRNAVVLKNDKLWTMCNISNGPLIVLTSYRNKLQGDAKVALKFKPCLCIIV